MTAYELYLFVHIVTAMVWVGAAFLMFVFAGRISVARDAERMRRYARDAEWLGLRLYLPANVLVLVSAILLVHEGPWGYDMLWIQLGLGGFALSVLIGALVFAPQWPRVTRLAEAENERIQRRVRLLLVISGFDLGLLVGIVFEMTVKPTSADAMALFLTAALPVAGTASGVALARAHENRVAELVRDGPAIAPHGQ